jgi:hypothetical protein
MFRSYLRLIGAFVLAYIATPTPTFATVLATIVPCSGVVVNGQGTNCTICSLATLAQNVLNDGIFVAVFLSAILFAWSGWKFATAESTGNPGQINEAKSAFWHITGGLVLILGAWIIVSVIVTTLTGNSTWNKLCNQAIIVRSPFV